MAVRSDFGKFGDTRNTTVQVTHPSTNCREEPSNLHAPRPRHFPSRQRQRQSTGKKSETGPQGVRESAVETFHKRGGGSRVTKAIFCSRSLLTLVRRSSGIGKTERGSKAGSGHNEIRSDIDKYQRTGFTGFFSSPSTHHYFEKPHPSSHTTTQNGLSITTGRSRKKCRWCEGRERHGKFRKQQRDGAAHTEQKTASRSPLASKKNRGG